MRKILGLSCLCITTAALSQTTKDTTKTQEASDERVFTTVQYEAYFPGGKAGWQEYLENNLKGNVPSKNKAPVGKYSVIVSFIVAKDGSINDVKAENDPGYGTAAEAVRVIRKGPRWKPAIQNDRVVTYRARQQITFVVSNE